MALVVITPGNLLQPRTIRPAAGKFAPAVSQSFCCVSFYHAPSSYTHQLITGRGAGAGHTGAAGAAARRAPTDNAVADLHHAQIHPLELWRPHCDHCFAE